MITSMTFKLIEICNVSSLKNINRINFYMNTNASSLQECKRYLKEKKVWNGNKYLGPYL